jgi:hypothetical protein
MYALIEFGCRGTERANFSVPSDERLSASLLDIFSALEEWETDKMAEITKGRFGFHQGGSKHEPPTAAYIQIYVKSSALSRTPDLAISAHLTTEAEIDEFVDDALAELEQVRIDAKKELAAA